MTHPISRFALLAVCWLFACGTAFSQTPASIERIGDVSVTVPVPSSGFSDTRQIQGNSQRAQFLRDTPNLPTSAGAQTLAVYLPADEIIKYLAGGKISARVFFVTTPANSTKRNLSQREFQEVVSELRKVLKEGGSVMEKLRSENESEVAAALATLARKFGVQDAKPDVQSPIVLEIFQDDQTSIGITYLTSEGISVATQRAGLNATAVISTLLKGKIITLRVDSPLRSRADIEWVKTEASKWHLQLAAAN